ncbi:MAG: hypothetical protein FJZ63_04220, partial [Chlamydiae bacterium]|nr:hypothetical protein [Chlamydiota bacterium]
GYLNTGFFAPNSRLGSVEDFKYFVNYLHEQGVGVILDFIPNHFAIEAYGLKYFQDQAPGESSLSLAEMARKVWYSYGSELFKYSKKKIREFLISSAHFWLKEMHIDGLRVDCLSGVLKGDKSTLFLKDLNQTVRKDVKGSYMIAEDFSGNPSILHDPKNPSDLGFDSKWNVGWNYFVLEHFTKTPRNRKFFYADIKKAIAEIPHSRDSVAFLSHDEFSSKSKYESLLKSWIKDYKDPHVQKDWKNLITLLMMTPGHKLLLSGLEFGVNSFWDEILEQGKGLMNSYENPTAFQTTMQQLVAELAKLYKEEVFALEKAEIEWLEDPKHLVHAYRRSSEDTSLVVLHNFTDATQEEFTVSLPKEKGQTILLEQVFVTDKEGKDQGKNYITHVETLPDKVVYKVRVPRQNTLIIKEKRTCPA